MEERFQFLKDVESGIIKIAEVTKWILEITNIEIGREKYKQNQEQTNEVVIYAENLSQKNQTQKDNLTELSQKKVKRVNFTKPKGDVELKHIQYRITDGRYIGRKQINGQIITVYAKTQKECMKKLQDKIKEATTPNYAISDSSKYLLGDMFMQWYKQEKEPFIKIRTQKDLLLVHRTIESLHNISIKKITKPTLIAFFTKLPENRTKEKTRLYLNACLKYYFNEGIIQVNPCANVKVRKSNARKQAFTFEQQNTILENLKQPLKTVILVYLITGLRKNELNFRGIENDIDFDNCILKAENLKGRNFVKRYKQIKLSKEAIKLIMNNIDHIHKYTAETAYREFATFLEEHKIEGSIVNLRHTFATNCFYLDKQDLTISREMGHSRTQITKDIYTDIDYHLSKEKIIKLYNNLYNIE